MTREESLRYLQKQIDNVDSMSEEDKNRFSELYFNELENVIPKSSDYYFYNPTWLVSGKEM